MNENTQPGVLMLRRVAEQLGPLRESVVFLGGAVTGLLLTDPAAPEVRFTEDVDVIVEIASYLEYYRLEETLRGPGFLNVRDMICRWKIGDLIVDVMPTDEKILGFSNRWYPLALATAVRCELDDGLEIRLITAPCFLSTKLEAFRHPQRDAHGDYLLSRDLTGGGNQSGRSEGQGISCPGAQADADGAPLSRCPARPSAARRRQPEPAADFAATPPRDRCTCLSRHPPVGR